MTHHTGQEENEGRAQHAAPDGNSEILRTTIAANLRVLRKFSEDAPQRHAGCRDSISFRILFDNLSSELCVLCVLYGGILRAFGCGSAALDPL